MAVAALVAFHAFPALPSGRFGFDLALAVAGYVVTRRLLAEAPEVRRVWADMLLWAVPPVALVAATVLIGGLFLLPPAELADQAWVIAWTAAGLGGEVLRQRGGYDPAVANELTGPAWVLGVAAQLALGWTVVLWGLRRMGRVHWAAPAALAGAALSLAIDGWWRATGLHIPADYLAPARAWGFLLGAAVAAGALRAPGAGRERDPAGMAGLLLAFWLWTWPLLLLPRMLLAHALSLPETAAALILAAGLAVLAQRLIAAPVARLFSGRPRGALVAMMMTLGVLSFAGLSLTAMDGLPGRASPAVRMEEASAQLRPPLHAMCVVDRDPGLPPAAACTIPTGAKADVVLWGNSHADHLAPAVLAWAGPRGLAVREAAQSGCLPVIEAVPTLTDSYCAAFNRAAMAEWAREKPAMVLLGAGWTVVLDQQGAGEVGLEALAADLTTTIRSLRAAIGPEGRIVLLGTTPDYAFSPARCHARRAFLGLDTDRCDRARPANAALAALVDARLEQIAASEPGTVVFRPWTAFCDGALCRTRGPDGAWYADRNHLTAAGGRQQLAALSPVLNQAPSR
ncbi:hypothetical protein GCM10009101_06780 [Brevundimonas lenta]